MGQKPVACVRTQNWEQHTPAQVRSISILPYDPYPF